MLTITFLFYWSPRRRNVLLQSRPKKSGKIYLLYWFNDNSDLYQNLLAMALNARNWSLFIRAIRIFYKLSFMTITTNWTLWFHIKFQRIARASQHGTRINNRRKKNMISVITKMCIFVQLKMFNYWH